MRESLRTILDRDHRRDTLVLAVIMVPVITGLYGGTLFVPTALTTLRGLSDPGPRGQGAAGPGLSGPGGA